MSTQPQAAYSLPALPYAYSALEPHIDAQTMEIHHGKHHQAYITKVNAALEGTAFAGLDPAELLKAATLDQLPADKRQAVINHGGGHFNHSLFWPLLSAHGGGEPGGELGKAIASAFGGFAQFKEQFASAAQNQFGSGWAWLAVDSAGKLSVLATANQDNPVTRGAWPLLGLDVWEHAYYLKYQNRRPDYVSAWWNVVNWGQVEDNWKKVK